LALWAFSIFIWHGYYILSLSLQYCIAAELSILHKPTFAGGGDRNIPVATWPCKLRLTSLAPDIIEAILRGDEPDGLSLEKLRKDLPVKWDAQMKVCGHAK